MLISEAVNRFLEYCEITKNHSLKTIENYTHYLERFQDFINDDIDTSKINLELINKFRVFLHRFEGENGKTLGIKTQNYHMIALRAFFKYLVKNDIEILAPEKIELGKIPQRTVEALSREEIERLFNAVDKSKNSYERDIAILEMLYSTGLRVSELVSLNREQVDLERREFMIRGKGKKPRIVFVSEKAALTVKKYIETRQDSFRPLFINAKKVKDDILNDECRRLSRVSIEKIVRNLGLFAGIIKKVTPHIIRHSYATNLLINGADIRSVQEMLGHSSITTTQVYTHLTDKKLREIHEKFHN